MAASWALMIRQPRTSSENHVSASPDDLRTDLIRERDNESDRLSSLERSSLDQIEQDGDSTAATSSYSSEDVKAPSKPRWQQRALQRHRCHSESLKTRMRTSSSLSSIGDIPEPEIEPATRRQLTFASTSLHFPRSTATPERSSVFTSLLTPLYFSPRLNIRSQPSDIMSVPFSPLAGTYFSPQSPRVKARSQTPNLASSSTTTITPTLGTSRSWVTCSDPDETTALITSPTVSTIVQGTPPDNEDRQPRKLKIFDMLSARDRKKKKDLPQSNTTALQAIRAAPSIESLLPQQAPGVYNTSKLSPRGAAERQDFSSLREFLDNNPAPEEDKVESHGPRSDFEWGSDDEEGSKVRSSQRKHMHMHGTMDKGKASGDERSEGSGVARGFRGALGSAGQGEDYGVSGPGMGNAGSESAGYTAGTLPGSMPGTGRLGVFDHVSGWTPSGNLVGGDSSSPRRGSFMQAFQDPVWHRGYDAGGEAAADRQPLIQPSPGRTPGDGSSKTGFLARLKRGKSALDLRKGSSHASAHEAAKKSPMTSTEIYSGQTGETITRCWSDNATPSKRGRRQKNVETTVPKPILPPPPPPPPRSQCDETLRMLEGEIPPPGVLVNPFEDASANDNDNQQLPVGLGITQEQEQLANDNLAQSRMSFRTFAAQKRQRQEEAAGQDSSHMSQSKQTTTSRPATPSREARFFRRLTTIDEANSEDGGENTAADQNAHFNLAIPDFGSRHLNLDGGDAISVNTIESDAIPPPLNVQKLRAKDKDPIESQLGNSLMNIPVVLVDRSSKHFQPPESKSFIPRRNSQFREMIRETSRVQAAKLGNHPAFRDNMEDNDSASEYSLDDDSDRHPDSTAQHARVDSGVGIKDGEVADEGYKTGPVGQQEFASSKALPSSAKVAEGSNCRRERVATLMSPTEVPVENAEDIDLQTLRRELSLPPLQLPTGPASPKHPNHPFTWHHEKVMCYGVHNPKTVQPGLPAIPEHQPVDMSLIHQKQISLSPTKGKLAGVKVCMSCGINCCRFANLILTSKIAKSNDFTSDTVRMKAEQLAEKLRTFHPNGIEEYDTFLACSLCKRKICPGCSTKCTERVCQAIICVDCTPETGVCPVHNAE